MNVLLITGALSEPSQLKHVEESFPDKCDLHIISLPGNGGVSLPAHGSQPKDWAESVIDHYRETVSTNPPDLILGESIAGCVCLYFEKFSGFRDVPLVLLDPPLSPSKLVYVRDNLRRVAGSEHVLSETAKRQSLDLFGYDFETCKDLGIIYYDVLHASTAKKLLLTGSESLWPLRAVNGMPCCIDHVDEYILKGIQNLSFQRIENVDHTLIRKSPEKIINTILNWYSDI